MAYNEQLADRARAALEATPRAVEKKMMGGLTFMVNSKMCVGIMKDELMLRIAPEEYEQALERNGCCEMNFTGKPMMGFVFVDEECLRNRKDFMYWIDLALAYNKKAKSSKKKK
jgi:TfoX/Sxy family transcriptional regulator of competence genes